MSVKLRERENKDGSISFVLDIYRGPGNRTYEFLKHLQLTAGTSPADRQKNKENRAMAKQIAISRAHALSANDYDIQTDQSKKVLVLDWMKRYSENYTKKDIRVIEGVYKRFETFLTKMKKTHLVMRDFDEALVLQFVDELVGKSTVKNEGAKTYYARFRKMVRQAVRENLIYKNPCQFIKPPTGQAKEKEVLKFEELQLLANTSTDAEMVKRAFLFCAVTGLRFCDVKELTWDNLNTEDRLMNITQSKTSKVGEFPLNQTALNILKPYGKGDDKVFDLPTANGCNKSLQLWVDRAKIKKKITWHCARHSYGTNLIYSGTDIFTASQLLGHASLTHTKRYVRASREMNQNAVDKLPTINL